MSKILFILKKREDYNSEIHTKIGLTTGLYNSASFVNEMLNKSGIESYLEVVNDNNDIDREVTKYKPTHCIIEALWVVPSKFHVLQKLHPKVKWIIRIHSELPFMANEGIAMRWFGDYIKFDNVILAPNAPRMLNEIKTFAKSITNWNDDKIDKKVIYLPNTYPRKYDDKDYNIINNTINISCFGAIRPLKNHLMQALAAVSFAEDNELLLNFHINHDRIEMKGEPILHNLKGLFEHLHSKGHKLITHTWTDRKKFLEICKNIDIGMQVSFSETFNIVAADLLSQGVPVVGSTEIPFFNTNYTANPVDFEDIKCKLTYTYINPYGNVYDNRANLHKYCKNTKTIWNNYFRKGMYV